MSDNSQYTFGVIGLGKMGGGIARHALSKGLRVQGLDKTPASDDLRQAGLVQHKSVTTLAQALRPPRIVFLYLPAGTLIDDMLRQLSGVLEKGDIVADGGNSYWGDSIRRHARVKPTGLRFVDVGTSGGPGGALNGACFMVGGDQEPVAVVEPILKLLAVPGGYIHAGGPGTGHFVKLVHNGIEFGMLQAIGEGVDLLERYRKRCRRPKSSRAGGMVLSFAHGSSN